MRVRQFGDKNDFMISGLLNVYVCCQGLDFEVLPPDKEVQIRLTMVGTLSSCVPGDSPVLMIHCQDLKKFRSRGVWYPGYPTAAVSSPDSGFYTTYSGVFRCIPAAGLGILLPRQLIHIGDTHILHPFFHHRFDVGPILSPTLFNYRITVLRDGVKPAAFVGRSRRADSG